MKKLIPRALVLFLSPMLIGWGAAIQLGGTVPAAGGSSESLTISDDFSTDTDAHYDVWSGITSCVVTTTGEGFMATTGSGLCHPKDGAATPPGTQPTSTDHWALYTYTGASSTDSKGPAVRVISTDPGVTDFNYVVRCTSNLLVIRNCKSGDDCQDHHDTGIACTVRSDDSYGLAPAGTGVNTELCVWYWDSAGPAHDEKPSETWGNADFCSSAETTISNAKLTGITDCGGDTVCEDWDIDGVDPGPPTQKGDYADVGTDCAAYSGTAGTVEVDAFSCGDL